MIDRCARQPAGEPYAVFDADNTTWKNDIEEGLLAFMEQRGLLSPGKFDTSLKPIAFKPGESLTPTISASTRSATA